MNKNRFAVKHGLTKDSIDGLDNKNTNTVTNTSGVLCRRCDTRRKV